MMNPAEFANIAKAENDFWWYRGMRRITFRLLAPHLDGRRIERTLEIGAGTGHFSRVLERRYGWRVFPLDLSWEGLQHGRRIGVERTVQADMRWLPYCDNSFDAALSMDVLVHLPRGEEEGPLREMARVLRPGGLFVLRVSALDVLRSRHSEFTHERQRFTRGRLLRCVEPLGIRVLRCTYLNSLLMPVALARFRVWEPLTRQPAASGVEPVARWLNALLEIPLRVEANWLGAGGGFPLGQSLFLIGEKRAVDG
jgi:SAM-dependent methyltransferase